MMGTPRGPSPNANARRRRRRRHLAYFLLTAHTTTTTTIKSTRTYISTNNACGFRVDAKGMFAMHYKTHVHTHTILPEWPIVMVW